MKTTQQKKEELIKLAKTLSEDEQSRILECSRKMESLLKEYKEPGMIALHLLALTAMGVVEYSGRSTHVS